MTMKRLWAPWRFKYVTGKFRGCFFCQYVKGRKNDKRNFILQRSSHAFSLLNLYPYNNGHAMVAPRRHVSDLALLSGDERADLINLLIATQKLFQKVLKPHGFNCGINLGRAAGAGVEDHLHIHLVPRWNGDTNFMPVLGGAKVISQSLEALYQLLAEELRKRKRRSKSA